MQMRSEEQNSMVGELTAHEFTEGQSQALVSMLERFFIRQGEGVEEQLSNDKDVRQGGEAKLIAELDRIRREDREDREAIEARVLAELDHIRREDKDDREQMRREWREDMERIDGKQERLNRWMTSMLTVLIIAAVVGAMFVFVMDLAWTDSAQ